MGLFSAASSAYGATEQADATTSAQNSANQTQLDMLAKEQAVEKPYVDAGTGALTQEQNLLGLNGSDAATKAMSQFQNDPAYKYEVGQGLSAVDNGAAANGTLRSGNTLRAEQTLGDNLANAQFGTYYNRLAGISQLGQASASNTGAADVQTGNSVAQTDASAGNALAGIYGNETKGIGSAVNNGVNALATLGSSGINIPSASDISDASGFFSGAGVMI